MIGRTIKSKSDDVTYLILLAVSLLYQPRSQGLIRFQYGGHIESGLDPGNEVVTRYECVNLK